MSRWLRALLVATVGFLQLPGTLQAQVAAGLPSGWQQMSPTDFATALRAVYDQSVVGLTGSDKSAARARAKELFLQIDLSNTALSYRTVEMLHWQTRFNLPSEAALQDQVLGKTKSALLSRKDNWAGAPFEEVMSKYWMMVRFGIDEVTRTNEVRRWVLAGGTLDQVPPIYLQYDVVRKAFSDCQVINGPFSVVWNGFITPPQTGNFVFSISPVNVNSTNPKTPAKLAMTVSVNGQVVLNSTPASDAASANATASTQSGWVSQGNPVGLTAGQPVAIQVTVSADVPSISPGVLHAMLFWQAPGGGPSIVPPDNLTQTNGGDPGLQATYSWTASGQQQSLTRVDPNIDFVWGASYAPLVLEKDPVAVAKASDAMWAGLTDPNFLQPYLNSTSRLHPFFREPFEVSAGLTTARRNALHILLQQNPALLDSLTGTGVEYSTKFYQATRYGTPDSALDVFGLWAARQANLVCIPNPNYFGFPGFDPDTREALASMALLTALQYPSHVKRLSNEFLQTADGSCSLPVAYTLAAANLGLGKLADWIAFLDAMLGDQTLIGDLRVNWLIARAEAEEIRYLPQNLNLGAEQHRVPRALDGKLYLDQAYQAAQSPAVKARVASEIACRLAWGDQFQAAQDFLAQASNNLPADQKATLAALQSQFTNWATGAAQAAQKRATDAQRAYVAQLHQRRDQAAARGDSAAATRYQSLIQSASAQ